MGLLYLCLVCFKPMAPHRYLATPYLGKLWYLKEKTHQSKQSFILKDIRTGEGQSLYKSYSNYAMQLSLSEKSFWDFA